MASVIACIDSAKSESRFVNWLGRAAVGRIENGEGKAETLSEGVLLGIENVPRDRVSEGCGGAFFECGASSKKGDSCKGGNS